MKRLDVINAALAAVGEAPLNEEDGRHPFVVSVLRTLEEENKQIQLNSGNGFWFNRATVTFLKDTTGEVPVPDDVLNAECLDYRDRYVLVDGYMFDPDNDTKVIDKDVKCKVVRLIDFERLPHVAAQAIKDRTVLRFHTDYDADAMKVQLNAGFGRDSLAALRAAEITNSRTNTRMNPEIARFHAGFRASRRGIR